MYRDGLGRDFQRCFAGWYSTFPKECGSLGRSRLFFSFFFLSSSSSGTTSPVIFIIVIITISNIIIVVIPWLFLYCEDINVPPRRWGRIIIIQTTTTTTTAAKHKTGTLCCTRKLWMLWKRQENTLAIHPPTPCHATTLGLMMNRSRHAMHRMVVP